MKQSPQQRAKIRICASCEWVYSREVSDECPICGFASYGARYVLGKNYHKELTRQQPYRDRKEFNFLCKLDTEIYEQLKNQHKYE
jgi:hypothetical protein